MTLLASGIQDKVTQGPIQAQEKRSSGQRLSNIPFIQGTTSASQACTCINAPLRQVRPAVLPQRSMEVA